MAKTAGMGDAFFYGGNDVSGDINSFSNIGGGPAVGDGTDITMSAVARLALERDGRMSFASFFDPATAHPVLSALPTADVIMSYFRGKAIGNPAACMTGKQPNYDGNRGADGSLMFACDAIANGSGLEWGVQLTPGLRVSAATDFGLASVDTGGSLSFGAQAYLQVAAFTGTSATIVVQDSADNSSFLAVAGLSFTVTSAPQAQRLAIANTATVRQFVRGAVSAGSFSSVTWALVVNKNSVAGQVF